jgi:DNA-binding transcriptional MerR regulator
MAQVLTISQLAKATGVAARTIRYYEHVGVLPLAARSPAGYRHYDRRDVERVHFVRRARVLGLPLRRLTALRATLDGPARPSMRPRLRALVGEQLSAVRQQIAELTRLQHELEQVLHRWRECAGPAGTAGCRCLETEGSVSIPNRKRR